MSYSDDMQMILYREKVSKIKEPRSFCITKDDDVYDDFLTIEDAEKKIKEYENFHGVFEIRKMTIEDLKNYD